MAYTPTKWENLPSEKTPLNADNLNKLENGVNDLHVALESGELKGEKGDKGDKGEKGDKGDKGATGPKGEPGVFDVETLTEDDITALKLKLGIS